MNRSFILTGITIIFFLVCIPLIATISCMKNDTTYTFINGDDINSNADCIIYRTGGIFIFFIIFGGFSMLILATIAAIVYIIYRIVNKCRSKKEKDIYDNPDDDIFFDNI